MVTATPTLGFVEALNASTKKIFQMKGRSRRSEFWWTQLLVFILSIFLTPIVGSILSLLTIPLKVRRLHDIGKSGWWLAINILLNVFLFIVMCVTLFNFFVSINSDDYDYINLISFLLQYIIFGLIAWIYGLIMLIFYCIFGLIAWIYGLIMLIFYCMDSKPGTNAYGPSPKYIEE